MQCRHMALPILPKRWCGSRRFTSEFASNRRRQSTPRSMRHSSRKAMDLRGLGDPARRSSRKERGLTSMASRASRGGSSPGMNRAMSIAKMARPRATRCHAEHRSEIRWQRLRTSWARRAIASAPSSLHDAKVIRARPKCWIIELGPACIVPLAPCSIPWHIDRGAPRWVYVMVLRSRGAFLRTPRRGRLLLRDGMIFEVDSYRPHCVVVPHPPFVWAVEYGNHRLPFGSVFAEMKAFFLGGLG